jgi:hypothetical protein
MHTIHVDDQSVRGGASTSLKQQRRVVRFAHARGVGHHVLPLVIGGNIERKTEKEFTQ